MRRKGLHKFSVLFVVVGIAALVFYFYGQRTPRFQSPDILVVGDSQISFGSGRVFMEFFENFEENCQPNQTQKQQMAKFGDQSFGAIGVRSSSLDTWVARDDAGKAMICEVDKKWGVNAGVYGISGVRDRKYVQIGQGDAYQFCHANQSPFEAMFENGYYDPKFLMLAFLGNSAERWSADQNAATSDVSQTMKQIPDDIPCIFMTTTPSYAQDSNRTRANAQANVEKAFHETGSRCSFVQGFTPETVRASEGNSQFFKTNDAGIVVDPQHPNLTAQRNFFQLKRADICRAIFEQLGT